MITYHIASENDWEMLLKFYKKVYREHHPLQNLYFWRWQFGNEKYGRSFIACEGDEVVAHVGANFREGYAWIINVFVKPEYRGRGILRELYGLARQLYPMTATNVNKPGLNMYRNMKWVRYCDLQRYVAINPMVKDITSLCNRVEIEAGWNTATGDYYWEQPGLNGFQLPDGSTAVDQSDVGGLRIIELVNPIDLVTLCWEAGISWVDFVTSWNDPLCQKLEDIGWLCNNESPVPWRLNPVVYGKKDSIPFLSEKPMPNDFIVKRTYSDHGRVGSLSS